jgi:hypothetical protein
MPGRPATDNCGRRIGLIESMKTLLPLVLAVMAGVSCGRPTGPGVPPVDRFAILAPASASTDLSTMFEPGAHAQWSQARSRLRAFQFYQQNLRSSCATCGANNLGRLLSAVPGGAFRYLTDHAIQIGVEAGSVKEHTCDGRQLAQVVIEDIAPIYHTGSHVTFIAMDEPFTAALPVRGDSPFGRCNFSIDQTVVQVDAFMDTVRATYPDVRIGLIEPYPYFRVDEIMTFVRALEDNEQTGLEFFRLDYDVRHRYNVDANTRTDLLRLRDFLNERGIEFEVIVTGYDGRTDAASVASAMALAYEISGVVGRPHAVVFQDWSADRLGLSTTAVNLPEQQAGSLTWLVNNGLGVFR